MSTVAPYIPPRDADYDIWLLNFTTLLTATPTAYGLVAGDATICAAQYTTWHAAFLAATNPGTRTSVTVAAKDVARINSVNVIRPYAQRIAVNPSISNSLKIGIGVNPRGTVPTPVPPPTTFPIVGLLAATPGVFQLAYKDSSLGATKKKPFGAIGMELWIAYGTSSGQPVSDAGFIGSYTKSPLFVDTTGFTGKVASIYARWATRSGPGGQTQPGPWSTVLSATVV